MEDQNRHRHKRNVHVSSSNLCPRIRCQRFAPPVLHAVFGVMPGATDKVEWKSGESADGASSNSEHVAKYLDAFASFRDEVRALAKAGAEPRALMSTCDRLRDHTMVDLGVRLEDRPDGKRGGGPPKSLCV